MSYTTKIGHAHLKVRNLQRSIDFYTRYLKLQETERVANYAFLSAGQSHHDIALQEVSTVTRAICPMGDSSGADKMHDSMKQPFLRLSRSENSLSWT